MYAVCYGASHQPPCITGSSAVSGFRQRSRQLSITQPNKRIKTRCRLGDYTQTIFNNLDEDRDSYNILQLPVKDLCEPRFQGLPKISVSRSWKVVRHKMADGEAAQLPINNVRCHHSCHILVELP